MTWRTFVLTSVACAGLAGCGEAEIVEEPEGTAISTQQPIADTAVAAPAIDTVILVDSTAAVGPGAGDSAQAAGDSVAVDRTPIAPPAISTVPASDTIEVPDPYPFAVSVSRTGRDSILVRAEEFAHVGDRYQYAFIGPYVAATWDEAVIVSGPTFEITQPRTFSADSIVRSLEVRTVYQGRLSDASQYAEFTIRRSQPVISLLQIMWRALETFVLLALTGLFIRGLSWILNQLGERNPSRRLLFKRMDPIIRSVIWVSIVIFIVRVFWSVDQNNLIAISAAAGVAIGLASQDIVRNLFGGIVLLTDQPFQVGDKVQIGQTYGEVKSIGIRSTRITTPDDSEVSVPNSVVLTNDVSNANAGNLDMQVVIHLYLPGWVDLRLAKKIAYESAAVSRFVYLDKPIVVIAQDEYHDTFVTHLKVKAYVLDVRDEFAFSSDVTERARLEFRKAGLIKPYHGARAWYDVTEEIRQADETDEGSGSPRPEAAP